jgi:hypothetical protein
MLKRRRVLDVEGFVDGGADEGPELSLDLRVQSQAQLLLGSFGHVQSPAGEVGPLHAKEVGVGG